MMNEIDSKLKKIFVTILKLPLYILLSPFYLIKGLTKLSVYIFKSLMYSIRRKISANYLTLYILVSGITFIFMIGGFLIVELSEKSYEVYSYVDNVLDNYEKGKYTYEDVEEKISSLAEVHNCGIKLDFSSNQVIKSDRFYDFYYPRNIWEKIGAIVNYRMYFDSMSISIAAPENVEINNGTLELIHPIQPYYRHVYTLAVMLLISITFGFFLMLIIGSISNRKILKPLYTMTITAKNISIHNMEERLDVSKAKYELKDLAITLNDMLDRLNRDYNKQKRFVSDVSHELRTPISIVNGYANMLERWGKDDEAVLDEAIEAIISEAKNMQVLVENLLTLVRSDNQTLKYNKEDFYINELVEEVTKEMQMINTKKQYIYCNTEENIKVNMDMTMIKQMLRIFVDNAVKYTPPSGKIDLNCYASGNQCYIHIIDTGIGIAKKDLPYLFDRFYRSDESRTRQTGGHGLGLSIAKVIVLGHGGTIKVKSRKNEGSEFTIIFPLA